MSLTSLIAELEAKVKDPATRHEAEKTAEAVLSGLRDIMPSGKATIAIDAALTVIRTAERLDS